MERKYPFSRTAQGCLLYPAGHLGRHILFYSVLTFLQPYSFFQFIPFRPGLSRSLSRRHRFGFIRCEVRQSRLIRRLEVHFLQNLPPAESIWQEKPPYEAVRTTVCCICKSQSGSGKKGLKKGKKQTFNNPLKPYENGSNTQSDSSKGHHNGCNLRNPS